MSTAAHFGFWQPFPFCVSDISGTVPAVAQYVGNLTLAQVMQFAWNLENLSITVESGTSATSTTGGGTTTLNAGMTVSYSPFASDFMDIGRVGSGNMAMGDPTSFAAFASCPVIRQPNERVCIDSGWLAGLVLAPDWSLNSDTNQYAAIAFWVGTDPLNSGKYRIYYNLFITREAGGGGPPQVNFFWNADGTIPSGFSLLTSGTMSIGGYSWPWYCVYRADSATGGALSATSSDFTY